MNSRMFAGKAKAFVALFAVLLLAGAAFAFNAARNNSPTERRLVQQWYSITPTSSSTPSSQNITGQISAPPDTDDEGCAQLENTGNFCGVLLQFSGSTAPNLNGQTVQQAVNMGAAIVTGTATGGYSRLP